MELMESELESVLNEREGYRNRVRSLEIALTETTMECDRLTWGIQHAKDNDEENKNRKGKYDSGREIGWTTNQKERRFYPHLFFFFF